LTADRLSPSQEGVFPMQLVVVVGSKTVILSDLTRQRKWLGLSYC